MEFIERNVEFPGRKKIIKVDENNQPIIGAEEILVKVERAEGVEYEEGTILNAEIFDKGNWRVDDSISFTAREDNDLPAAETNKTQIITKSNGETWIIPPYESGKPSEIIGASKLNKLTGEGGSGVEPNIHVFRKYTTDSNPTADTSLYIDGTRRYRGSEGELICYGSISLAQNTSANIELPFEYTGNYYISTQGTTDNGSSTNGVYINRISSGNYANKRFKLGINGVGQWVDWFVYGISKDGNNLL